MGAFVFYPFPEGALLTFAVCVGSSGEFIINYANSEIL